MQFDDFHDLTEDAPAVRPDEANEPALGAGHAIVVVRIPKSASTSLSILLDAALPGGNRFCLPNTLDVDSSSSQFQRLRHARHSLRLNFGKHGRLRTSRVFDLINETAQPGDLISGGHVDFATCLRRIRRPIKFVTLLREPAARIRSEYAYLRVGHSRKSRWTRFDAAPTAKAAARYSFNGYLSYLLERENRYANIASRYIGIREGDDIAHHFRTHAALFGTVELLPVFVADLARRAGRGCGLQHANPTPGTAHQGFTREERSKIERLYWLDHAVHSWCTNQVVPAPAREACPTKMAGIKPATVSFATKVSATPSRTFGPGSVLSGSPSAA